MRRISPLVLLLAVTQAIAQEAPTRARPATPAGAKATGWHATGAHGAVAAGGAEAVDAGMAILRDGGNAADGAAATILALTVTDAHLFCFGGEVPILAYDARRGVVEAIAGQGAAPRLATRERFAIRGDGIPAAGIEPAAVPGALDAIVTLLDRQGTKTFAQVAAPTLRLLDRGEFAWHADLARTLRRLIDAEAKSADRRRGLRLVADAFYRGPIAREIDAWSRDHGGLIRYTDLATHTTRVEEPVAADYRGYEVVKFGPWTQGPALLEALQILEGFDLEAAGHNSPEAVHLTAEAIKLAFADRDAYYGDPLFTDVPLAKLLDPVYAGVRRALIDRGKASLDLRPGDPIAGMALRTDRAAAAGPGGPSHDTTTCLVADGMGNVVAATPSGWSGVLAGDTGVWLGTRLQSFNTIEGHPNAIEPGKRPRITLTPTLVLKDGKPAFAVSVAGGDAQDQTTLQLVLDLIDFDMDPADAVRSPLFQTNQFIGSFRQKAPEPGSLELTAGFDPEAVRRLEAMGHKIRLVRGMFANPVLLRLAPDGTLDAAGDPRSRRHADAY